MQKLLATKDLKCVPHFAPDPQQCPIEELSFLLCKVLRQRVAVYLLERLAS